MNLERLQQATRVASFAILAIVAAHSSRSARAADESDMFKGKVLRVIVATDPGGGYDLRGRALARHLGHFLPGNPTVVSENMPGGGSVVALNYLYNVAPRDGSVMLLFQRTVLSTPLLAPHGVRFDLTKFTWLGSMGQDNGLVVSWYDSPIQKTEDLFTKEMIVPTASQTSMPTVLNALIGTKFKIISGYQGSTETVLAMQRGEVMGISEWSWSDLKTSNLYLEKKVNLLLQTGLSRVKELPDVPLALDFAKSDEDREILEAFVSPREIAYPVVMPPDIPAGQVKVLRDAFMAMGRDAEFEADLHKSGIDITLSPGEAVEAQVARTAALPTRMAERVRALITPP